MSSEGRSALGVGIAVGGVTLASFLLYYFFVERRKCGSADLLSERSTSTTVFEKVNADVSKGKPFRVKVSHTASDRKKRSKKKKTKSGDSRRDKESIRGEPVHIPTNLASCDCRTGKNAEQNTPSDSEGIAVDTDEFNADLLIPQVHPIIFEKYQPYNWMKLSAEDMKENLCLAALKERHPVKTNILTPFRATLNGIAYGHKHAKLIKELVENYSYLES